MNLQPIIPLHILPIIPMNLHPVIPMLIQNLLLFRRLRQGPRLGLVQLLLCLANRLRRRLRERKCRQ